MLWQETSLVSKQSRTNAPYPEIKEQVNETDHWSHVVSVLRIPGTVRKLLHPPLTCSEGRHPYLCDSSASRNAKHQHLIYAHLY
jgi:hypothetical protein